MSFSSCVGRIRSCATAKAPGTNEDAHATAARAYRYNMAILAVSASSRYKAMYRRTNFRGNRYDDNN